MDKEYITCIRSNNVAIDFIADNHYAIRQILIGVASIPVNIFLLPMLKNSGLTKPLHLLVLSLFILSAIMIAIEPSIDTLYSRALVAPTAAIGIVVADYIVKKWQKRKEMNNLIEA